MSTVSSLIGSPALAQQTLADAQGAQPQLKTVVAGGQSYAFDESAHIASGADGKVFFGKDAGDREVCIKVAKDSGFGAADTEHQALSLLGPHASIVSSLGYEASSHTLVIEKCDTKIDAQEPLSKGVNVKAGWIASLKDGVDFMHARNVAHGDLNMKNMLLRSDEALIADFGGAKIFGTETSLALPLDPELAALGIPPATITKADALEGDQRDFLKMSFNMLAGRQGDLVLPGGAEKATALEGLPGSARALAEQVFFGSDPVATRYARLPTLLTQLSAPPVVDLSKLA
jgi:serine/threonine protein kinase